MVNCTYISRKSTHIIQFHLKTSFQLVQSLTAICLQLLPCSYLQAGTLSALNNMNGSHLQQIPEDH